MVSLGEHTLVSLEKQLTDEHKLVLGALAAPQGAAAGQVAPSTRAGGSARLRDGHMGSAPKAQLSPGSTQHCLLMGCGQAELCFQVPTLSGAQKDSSFPGSWYWDAQGVARLLGRGKALLSSFLLGCNLITEVAAFSRLLQLKNAQSKFPGSVFHLLVPSFKTDR